MAGCNDCGGAGFIVTCPDDMCRGAGECMHGDGETTCACEDDTADDWDDDEGRGMTQPCEPLPDDLLVTVCASCLTAACWLGEFYCDDYKTADITTRTVAQLRALGEEHEDYWRPGRANGEQP